MNELEERASKVWDSRMEHHQRFVIHNRQDAALEVVFEPWGMPFDLDPGTSIELNVYSPSEGALETDVLAGQLLVWCWSGCRIQVLRAGTEVYSTLDGPAVPPTPPGQPMRGFLKKLFGE